MTSLYPGICGSAKWIMLVLLLSFLSFCGCTVDQACSDRAIQPAFIGFAPGEIDTFIVRRYKADGNFDAMIDTFKIYKSYYNTYQIAQDTTTVFDEAGVDSIPLFTGQIQVGYDWQIYVPSVSRTVSISNIVKEDKTVRCNVGFPLADKKAVCNCGNPIISMTVDNQPIVYSDTTTIFNVFITR